MWCNVCLCCSSVLVVCLRTEICRLGISIACTIKRPLNWLNSISCVNNSLGADGLESATQCTAHIRTLLYIYVYLCSKVSIISWILYLIKINPKCWIDGWFSPHAPATPYNYTQFTYSKCCIAILVCVCVVVCLAYTKVALTLLLVYII